MISDKRIQELRDEYRREQKMEKLIRQLPALGFQELLRCWEIGNKKHGVDAVDDPVDRVRELRSIKGHLRAYENGELQDEDDGQHPLSAVAVRCLKLIHADMMEDL